MTITVGVRKKTVTSAIVDIDRLCRMMGVDTLEDFDEQLMNNDGTYSYVYGEARKEGKTEEEAEELAMEAESEERDEATTAYRDAVFGVAEKLFGEHRLQLQPVTDWSWKVVPVKSWADAAGEIVQTINGVGMFEFKNARELCSSGPYTAREAVLSHLGWIKDWPDVYEGTKAKSMVDRAMRRR